MKKILLCAALIVSLCGLSQTAFADTINISTGFDVTGGFDNNWKAAYLGAFEIGKGDASHDGVQLGERFTTPGKDYTETVSYDAGDKFDLGVLKAAYNAANLQNAFVYDADKWPLGENGGAWADLGAGWIGSVDGRYDNPDIEGRTTNHLAGYYVYETTFLASDLFSALTGFFVSDNQLLAILVNGVEFDLWKFDGTPEDSPADNFEEGGWFNIGRDWVNLGGNNTLTFIVNNHNSWANNFGNPAGLWISP